MNLIETYNGSGFYAQYAASADNALYDENGTPLTSYQPVSSMTAYQEAGDYYSASNPSGFISEVPAGTMNESSFEYSGGMITAYNGSAFKAGDEFPQSATEAIETVTANSGDWNATTDTVSSNSGVWGGSALPISAGPGIKFEMVNDTLVASTDETMLFSGSDAWGYGTITLSEPLKNFERIKVLATRAFSADGNTDKYSGPWCEFDCAGIASTTASWGAVTPAIYEGPYWKYSTYTANATFTQLNWSQGGYIKVTNPSDYAEATSWIDGKAVGIKAVIGINRK